LLAAFALLLAGCNWFMARGGPERNGYNSRDTVLDASNVDDLQQAWEVIVGREVPEPTISNSVAYFGSAEFKLYALDAFTGALHWSATTGGQFVSSATIAGENVYAVSSDERLYVYDRSGVQGCSGAPKTCQPLWTAPAGPGFVQDVSPVVTGGMVYVPYHEFLYAYDAAGVDGCSGSPKTCAPLWEGHCRDGAFCASFSAAAVADGTVYVGSMEDFEETGRVTAFDAAGVTGCSSDPGGGSTICMPLWTARIGGAVLRAPAVANGLVYTIDESFEDPTLDTLRAFDAGGVNNCSGVPKVCSSLWQTFIGDSYQGAPAVANSVVYAASGTTLYAFDTSGTPLWTADGGFVGAPAISNGVVYVGGDGVQAFDAAGAVDCAGTPKKCSPLWSGSTPSGAGSPALADNGRVYGGSPGFIGTGQPHRVFSFALP
jgi:outer membrane protein assembly factor BamB